MTVTHNKNARYATTNVQICSCSNGKVQNVKAMGFRLLHCRCTMSIEPAIDKVDYMLYITGCMATSSVGVEYDRVWRNSEVSIPFSNVGHV